MLSFKEIMQTRFSCRKFEPRKVGDEVIGEIVRLAALSPSSLGLEPWKFVIVSKERHLKELGEICLGQGQVSGCSHAVVIVGRTDLRENDGFMQENIARKGDWLRGVCKSRFDAMSAGEREHYAALQCYLACANLVNAAKSLGVDSCIVAGLDFARLAAWLGLGAGYAPALVVALGFGAAQGGQKVRFAAEKTIIWK